MNRQRFFHAGPGAALLILVVVVLSMSMLGMLMLLGSRNDRALSERAVYAAEKTAALHAAAEEHFAQVIACTEEGLPLPDGFEMKDGAVYWQETAEQWVLNCAVDTETRTWRTYMMESGNFL